MSAKYPSFIAVYRADLGTLKIFADALSPKKLIPIHTEYKENFEKHFENYNLGQDRI